MHKCDENTPACQPYLDRVELNVIAGYKRWREGLERITNHTKDAELNDCRDTWGTSFERPLGDKLRGLLKEDRFRMVHICWPEPGVYWYIYQRGEAKKAKCGICNTKFSLAFPTAGRQVSDG
jgi:hypothetical protein